MNKKGGASKTGDVLLAFVMKKKKLFYVKKVYFLLTIISILVSCEKSVFIIWKNYERLWTYYTYILKGPQTAESAARQKGFSLFREASTGRKAKTIPAYMEK